MEDYKCEFNSCSEFPNFSCNCSDPAALVCYSHLGEHSADSSALHTFRKSYENPDPNTIADVSLILQRKIKSLFELRSQIIHQASKEISATIENMKNELVNTLSKISNEIDFNRKLLSEVSMPKIMIFNPQLKELRKTSKEAITFYEEIKCDQNITYEKIAYRIFAAGHKNCLERENTLKNELKIAIDKEWKSYWKGKEDICKKIAWFIESIIVEKENAYSHYCKGSALRILSEYEQALQELDIAIQLNPDMSEAYLCKGLVYKIQKKYEEALAEFNKSIEKNPKRWMAHLGKGNTLNKLGRYLEAIDEYDKALKIVPENFGILNRKGEVLCKIGKYEEALEFFDQGSVLEPEDPSVHYNIALALYNLNRKDDSLVEFQEAKKFASYEELSCSPDELEIYKELENLLIKTI